MNLPLFGSVIPLFVVAWSPYAAPLPATPVPDPRHISNGWTIPSEGYADQPYIVKTDDGAWLCVMTTGKGIEGAGGQHVVSMRNSDLGRPGRSRYNRALRTSEAVGNFRAGI